MSQNDSKIESRGSKMRSKWLPNGALGTHKNACEKLDPPKVVKCNFAHFGGISFLESFVIKQRCQK